MNNFRGNSIMINVCNKEGTEAYDISIHLSRLKAVIASDRKRFVFRLDLLKSTLKSPPITILLRLYLYKT